MDLQPIQKAASAAKYTLGYTLKTDTDKESEKAFTRYIHSLHTDARSAQDIYRAVSQFLKARITSPSEACFLLQGLPVVSFGDRGSVWVPCGLPDTWSTFVPKNKIDEAIKNPDAVPINMPQVLDIFSRRPVKGTVDLPVNGRQERATVEWAKMTLYDFAAGINFKVVPHVARSTPAIV
eukprot:2004587-Amphidinium_carterae.1